MPPLRMFTKLLYDLTQWPSFWSHLTHIYRRLIENSQYYQVKLWPLECPEGFSRFWPFDQVFHPRWTIFAKSLEIEAKLLTIIVKTTKLNVVNHQLFTPDYLYQTINKEHLSRCELGPVSGHPMFSRARNFILIV